MRRFLFGIFFLIALSGACEFLAPDPATARAGGFRASSFSRASSGHSWSSSSSRSSSRSRRRRSGGGDLEDIDGGAAIALFCAATALSAGLALYRPSFARVTDKNFCHSETSYVIWILVMIPLLLVPSFFRILAAEPLVFAVFVYFGCWLGNSGGIWFADRGAPDAAAPDAGVPGGVAARHRDRIATVRRTLTRLAVTDPSFDLAALESRVRRCFLETQRAWGARDIVSAAPYLSDRLTRDLEAKAADLRSRKRVNVVERVLVNAVNPIAVVDFTGTDSDRVTILFGATMVDYEVDESTRAVTDGVSEPLAFEEAWEFVSRSGQWVAHRILAPEETAGYLAETAAVVTA